MRDPTEKITSDNVEPNKPPITQPKATPDKSKFEAYMQEASGEKPGKVSPQQQSTPLQTMSQSAAASKPTPHTLLAQVSGSQEHLDTIQKKLQTPNLSMKRQHQKLLKDKLHDALGHIKSANTKLNIPPPKKRSTPKNAGPIAKFLGYVTDGQNQLALSQQRLKELSQKPSGELNPADMLLVQVKLSQAQQELEYSSVLLSKVIDIFKQVLNIQI